MALRMAALGKRPVKSRIARRSGGTRALPLKWGGPIFAALNEDGFMNLVTANETSNDITVLFGDGAGHFTAPISVDVRKP